MNAEVNGAVIEASNASFVDLLAENEAQEALAVMECDGSQDVNVVTAFGQVVITMFYRSWCGHCSLLVRQGPYLKHSRMSPVWG